MVFITILLFALFIGSFFMDEFCQLCSKILFVTFIISLFINISSYYIGQGEIREKKIKQQELILLKKREDQKQDSLLIILEAKIDDCIIKKDTILARQLLISFFHTSDLLSPYLRESFFKDEQLSYKKYWQQKRKEKLESLENVNEDSFFGKLFN